MIEPDALTLDRFLAELRERVDALRYSGVEVPMHVDSSVQAVLAGQPNPFELALFRQSAAHLLGGLDPEMAEHDGGPEVLTERLYALPANLRVSLRFAAERHEQHV